MPGKPFPSRSRVTAVLSPAEQRLRDQFYMKKKATVEATLQHYASPAQFVTKRDFESALRDLEIYPGNEDFEALWQQYCSDEETGVYYPHVLKRFTVPQCMTPGQTPTQSVTPRGRSSCVPSVGAFLGHV